MTCVNTSTIPCRKIEIVMTSVIQQWHEEHSRFSRLLDLVDAQLSIFHTGGEPDYDLIYDIVQYMREYADRFHHPREDVAFTRMVDRDTATALPLNRLLQEHRVIAVAGEALLARLDDIAADVVIERTAVEAAAATYLVYYRHHIATEESSVLPAAERLLTDDDWAAVAAAAPAGSDPLFGDNFDARYAKLRELVKAAQQAS